ncbi:MFS transporter [Marinobacterium jannaschii]|uniref:MFS transporter n=1 Tax=Marinobacterium jannaschii TaxID=64970 RepID=UPI000486363F|nr:MFS transporter [Marinobacterium jannaschii]
MSHTSSSQPASRWLALVSICVATFLIPQSMSAVNIALPVIASELQADAVKLSWLSTVNLWANVVLMLPAGRLADMIGAKRVYIFGTLCFALSSLLVLVVQDVDQLLVVRLLQGLSSSMVFGTAMAIVSSVFADSSRGTALGLTSTSVYLGLTCGPLIGGWLTEYSGWRSVFWGPVPLIIIAVLLVVVNVRLAKKEGKKERFDWTGSLLFTLWVTALFIGLSGLPEPLYLVLIGAGVVLLWCFVRQQLSVEYPLVRLRALRENRVLNRSMLTSLFMYGAHAPVLFLLSLYLQYIQGLSPTESGQLILVQALTMAFVSPLAGRLSDRFPAHLIATLGCLLFGAGFAILLMLDGQANTSLLVSGLFVQGLGFGLFSSPSSNAALASVPRERLGIASSLLNLARTQGNMFGMAIVVLLFNLMLGATEIGPEQYPQLLTVIRFTLALALGYTLLAAYFSYSRGRSEAA